MNLRTEMSHTKEVKRCFSVFCHEQQHIVCDSTSNIHMMNAIARKTLYFILIYLFSFFFQMRRLLNRQHSINRARTHKYTHIYVDMNALRTQHKNTHTIRSSYLVVKLRGPRKCNMRSFCMCSCSPVHHT